MPTNLTDSLHIHATKTDDVQPLLPFTKTLFVKFFLQCLANKYSFFDTKHYFCGVHTELFWVSK